MDRTITVLFYHLQPKQRNRTSFSSALKAAASEEFPERNVFDGDVQIQRHDPVHRLHTGEFMRRQTENLPPQLRQGGRRRLSNLRLDQDSGLGHGASFIYDSANGILVWENNRNGATVGRFVSYVESFAPSDGYEYAPVISEEAMRRLRRTNIRHLRVKVAAPTDLRAVEDREEAVRTSLVDLARIAQSAYVEVKVGVTREREARLPDRVRSIIRWLSRESDEGRGKVTKLRIEGKDQDTGDPTTIDVLTDRMKRTQKLRFRREDHTDIFRHRLAVLHNAYDHFGDELDHMFERNNRG